MADFTINYVDSDGVVKSGNTESSFKISMQTNGNAYDLHSAVDDKLTVKVANQDGFLNDVTVDLSAMSDMDKNNGIFTLPLDDKFMAEFPPDTYFIEVWVNTPDGREIFPSDSVLPLTVNPNIVNNSDAVTMTEFDQIANEWDGIKQLLLTKQAMIEKVIAGSSSGNLDTDKLNSLSHEFDKLQNDYANNLQTSDKQITDVQGAVDRLTDKVNKVATADVVNKMKSDIANNASSIGDAVNKINNMNGLTDKVDALSTKIDVIAGNGGTSGSNADFSSLSNSLADVSSTASNASSVASSAGSTTDNMQSDLSRISDMAYSGVSLGFNANKQADDLSSSVSSNSSAISSLSEAVVNGGGKATSSSVDFSSVDDSMNSMTTSITNNADEIDSLSDAVDGISEDGDSGNGDNSSSEPTTPSSMSKDGFIQATQTMSMNAKNVLMSLTSPVPPSQKSEIDMTKDAMDDVNHSITDFANSNADRDQLEANFKDALASLRGMMVGIEEVYFQSISSLKNFNNSCNNLLTAYMESSWKNDSDAKASFNQLSGLIESLSTKVYGSLADLVFGSENSLGMIDLKQRLISVAHVKLDGANGSGSNDADLKKQVADLEDQTKSLAEKVNDNQSIRNGVNTKDITLMGDNRDLHIDLQNTADNNTSPQAHFAFTDGGNVTQKSPIVFDTPVQFNGGVHSRIISEIQNYLGWIAPQLRTINDKLNLKPADLGTTIILQDVDSHQAVRTITMSDADVASNFSNEPYIDACTICDHITLPDGYAPAVTNANYERWTYGEFAHFTHVLPIMTQSWGHASGAEVDNFRDEDTGKIVGFYIISGAPSNGVAIPSSAIPQGYVLDDSMGRAVPNGITRADLKVKKA